MRVGVKAPILSKWTNVYLANGKQKWITRRLAHPHTLPIDMKATIFMRSTPSVQLILQLSAFTVLSQMLGLG
jgi:hypothetical protein